MGALCPYCNNFAAIYYAIVVSLKLTTQSNYYYTYPSDRMHGTLEVVLSDEESFYCNGTTYHLNNTGPLKGQTGEYTTNMDDLNLGPYIGFAIVGIVIFIVTRLFKGRYNQLLMMVKFREEEISGEIVPVKLSIAFTVLCNMSKLVSVQYGDLCGRRAMISDETAGSDARYFATLVYLICWGIVLIWMMTWVMTCSLCCMGPKPFMWFRRSVVVACIIMTCLWLVNFDPDLEFDTSDWTWFSLSVISLGDFIISGVFDIYLRFA